MNTFLNFQLEKESLESFGVYRQRIHDTRCNYLMLKIFNRGISEQYYAIMSGYPEANKRASRRAKYQLIIRRIF